MPGPQIAIDLGRIERNTRTVVNLCAASGIKVFGVTKGTCGMPQVARAMLRGGVHGIAESRFENIRRLRESGISVPIMLLRAPPISRVEETIRSVDISLQSELATITELSRIAERLGRVHDIILMVDLGDLREGIWPNDLLPIVEKVTALKGVRIAGLGTNLTCFGAIIPTAENMNQLIAHAYKVERFTGRPLDWISGGNSSTLPLLLSGHLPQGINNLRIGEAIIQGGLETFHDKPWEALEFDACRLSGDLIEVKTKPSIPIGESGIDAFGSRPVFVDEGDRLRAIANIGREDVLIEGLFPSDKGVRVLGASSDHLVLDVTDADPPLAVGDRVSFRLNYGALLMAMTSEYVEKTPMHDVEEKPGGKFVQVIAEGAAAAVLARTNLNKRLEAIKYDLIEPADPAHPPAGMLVLAAGENRSITLTGINRAVQATHSLGVIWIDSAIAMKIPGQPRESAGVDSVLANILGLLESPGPFQPQISPENVVLMGIREASDEEAAALKRTRATVFTMTDLDASGMRDVMREAIRVATNGTRGFHVCYSPTATEIPGWVDGSGGITQRETHQAMEAIALNGGMTSMSLSGLTADLDPRVAAEITGFVLSAFGKRIL